MSETGNAQMVVGLYSFPKSGNTWLRAIIAGLCDIPGGPGMLQKYVTDTHYGKVLENPWEFQGKDWYFYKSHRKDVLEEHQGEAFKTDRILYIYRHPLDVFMSYLNFVSKNVSPKAGESLPVQVSSVEELTPEELETLFAIFVEHGTLFPRNVAFGSLFEHVANFRARAEKNGDTLIMRYEDLYDDFEGVVQGMCDFLGLEDVNIAKAYRVADRRTKQNGKFFWKRQKENFRNYLSDEQVTRFVTKWADEMQALGYDTK